MLELRSGISGPLFYKSHDIFIYLESAFHDKQNDSQFSSMPKDRQVMAIQRAQS